MPKFISKTELEKLQTKDPQKVHYTGEIYPEIFSHGEDLEFGENMPLHCAVMWLGSFQVEGGVFPKVKCPVCGKEEALVPYMCGGSRLSGCHTLQFYCTNCHEQLVTNDYKEYFRTIYKYLDENKDKLKPTPKFLGCTSLPSGAEVISR